MNTPDSVLISILSWPRAWGRDEIAQTLSQTLGLAAADAQLLAPSVPPFIAGSLEPAQAQAVVKALRAKQVPALGVPTSRVAALIPPLVAKRLQAAEGAPEPLYMVEAWRGEGRGLLMRDVVLIVRGRISNFTRSTTVESDSNLAAFSPAIAAATMRAVTETRGGFNEALDLYTPSGPPVRITGRFDFAGFLGKNKGFTDGDNMDRVALRLGEEAPGATIDLAFNSFKPPRGLSLRLTGSTISSTGKVSRDDTPLFDFYSAWISVVQATIREWRARRANP